MDLSDSSLILKIGLSSEILRIDRPFAHLGPSPLPFPLTLRLPLPGRRRDSFRLGRLLTRAPTFDDRLIQVFGYDSYLPPS